MDKKLDVPVNAKIKYMKLKLNLPNPKDNIDQIEETINGHPIISKEEWRILDFRRHYNNRYDAYNIISRFLRSNVGKSWDELYPKLKSILKPEFHDCIWYYVFIKNVNGDYINSYGQPRKILKDPATVSWKIHPEYYIEDGILKCNQPYKRFKTRTRKQIKKKVLPPEKHYTCNFDHNVVMGLDMEYGLLKDNIKLWEENKETYRVIELVRSLQFKRNKISREYEYTWIESPKITHIKTHYD
jgi:outer membrane protein assembly factor BamE (lipoprotein component of BamABCDE complex)